MALTPSQRVTLIKEIGQRLGPEGYSLIDITLQQFGIQIMDQWAGNSKDYVLRLVQDAGCPILKVAFCATFRVGFHCCLAHGILVG
jgi:hypothetical protein